MALGVRLHAGVRMRLQKDFLFLLTGIHALWAGPCFQVGEEEEEEEEEEGEEARSCIFHQKTSHFKYFAALPCSPHGLLLWLAEIEAVNISDCRDFYDLHIFKRIKHSQQFSP